MKEIIAQLIQEKHEALDHLTTYYNEQAKKALSLNACLMLDDLRKREEEARNEAEELDNITYNMHRAYIQMEEDSSISDEELEGFEEKLNTYDDELRDADDLADCYTTALQCLEELIDCLQAVEVMEKKKG